MLYVYAHIISMKKSQRALSEPFGKKKKKKGEQTIQRIIVVELQGRSRACTDILYYILLSK